MSHNKGAKSITAGFRRTSGTSNGFVFQDQNTVNRGCTTEFLGGRFGQTERAALLDVFRDAADYFYDEKTAFRVFYSVQKD